MGYCSSLLMRWSCWRYNAGLSADNIILIIGNIAKASVFLCRSCFESLGLHRKIWPPVAYTIYTSLRSVMKCCRALGEGRTSETSRAGEGEVDLQRCRTWSVETFRLVYNLFRFSSLVRPLLTLGNVVNSFYRNVFAGLMNRR